MRLIDIVNNMETREIACGGAGVDRAIGAGGPGSGNTTNHPGRGGSDESRRGGFEKGDKVSFYHPTLMRRIKGEVLNPEKPTLTVGYHQPGGGYKSIDVHHTKLTPMGSGVKDEDAEFDPNTTNEGSTVEKWHNQ
jgi:hypothetical protein